jgi:Protein of unknown function (DUF3995)
MISVPRHLTAASLLAIAGLHVGWGRGSSFPFATREELADIVVGGPSEPSPRACYAVAGLLTAASALVAGAPGIPRRLRRPGVAMVTSVLAVRSAAGFTGRTDLLVPWTTSPRFRRADRRVLAPLCLLLAAGAATALRRP